MSKPGTLVVSLWFFIKHLACGFAALGAFTIKLLAVALRLLSPQHSWLIRFVSVTGLMLQCMGVLIMEVVLQDRLFLFVFGGQDASYADDEHALKNVYETRVCKQIWMDFWEQGQFFKAIVMLATFDHYDLQRLIIQDIEVRRNLSESWERRKHRITEEDMDNSDVIDTADFSTSHCDSVVVPRYLACSSKTEVDLSTSHCDSTPFPRYLARSSKAEGENVGHLASLAVEEAHLASEVSQVSSEVSFGMGAVRRALQDDPSNWGECLE